MRVIFGLLFWLLSGVALAADALPPLVPEGEKISDFPGWRIDENTSYNSVAYSPDGKFIVTGSGGVSLDSDYNSVRVWDARSGENIKILYGHTATVNSVAYSPDGKFIVSGSGSFMPNGIDSNDISVRIWNAQNGENIKTLQGHTATVNSVAYSPDGKFIVSGSGGISSDGRCFSR